MNEDRLGRLLLDVTTDLPSAPDRLASVQRRIRRRRTALAAAGGATACVALVLGVATVGAARTGTAERSTPDGAVAAPPARTAACSAPAGAPPASHILGTPQPVNQDALSRVAERVRPYVQRRFGDVFADVAIVPERDRVLVYRKPSAELDVWLAAEDLGVCVEAVDARYSARELERWAPTRSKVWLTWAPTMSTRPRDCCGNATERRRRYARCATAAYGW